MSYAFLNEIWEDKENIEHFNTEQPNIAINTTQPAIEYSDSDSDSESDYDSDDFSDDEEITSKNPSIITKMPSLDEKRTYTNNDLIEIIKFIKNELKREIKAENLSEYKKNDILLLIITIIVVLIFIFIIIDFCKKL